MPESKKRLSNKASRRFLVGFVSLSLALAFLAAMGIKSATENEQFQDEVEEMRRRYDPDFERSKAAAEARAVYADSVSSTPPVQDTLPEK